MAALSDATTALEQAKQEREQAVGSAASAESRAEKAREEELAALVRRTLKLGDGESTCVALHAHSPG